MCGKPWHASMACMPCHAICMWCMHMACMCKHAYAYMWMPCMHSWYANMHACTHASWYANMHACTHAFMDPYTYAQVYEIFQWKHMACMYVPCHAWGVPCHAQVCMYACITHCGICMNAYYMHVHADDVSLQIHVRKYIDCIPL